MALAYDAVLQVHQLAIAHQVFLRAGPDCYKLNKGVMVDITSEFISTPASAPPARGDNSGWTTAALAKGPLLRKQP